MVATHYASQDPGAILDHYADVIEGGDAYAGGTSYTGVPGLYSYDDGIESGDDTPLTATAAGTATTVVVAGKSWSESRWVKSHIAPYYLLCTSGADLAVNTARKITGWDNGTTTFTVDAFDEAPGDGATFTVHQGFSRLPNTFDPHDDDREQQAGLDRRFELALLPVKRHDWYGNGTETWEGELTLTLRLAKRDRLHDMRKSAVANLTMLASVITRTADPDHRHSTVRLIMPPDGGVAIDEDADKVVASVTMNILYCLQSGF